MSVDLVRDMIVEGAMWPEPVRVLSVERFGSMIQVDAVGTSSRQFYPAIIVTDEQLGALRIISGASGMDFSGDPESFHLAVEAQRIRLAYEYDPHFAANASTITPLPHQLDAVYRYMLKSPLVRFLLADEAGAGKTIMSGLLLKELKFRNLAERILIVVPPLVARQWQDELTEKFSEEFKIIDNGVLKANVGRNPWLENDRCITSIYWASRDNVLETLREADWDLIIVDEAHKMSAYRTGARAKKTYKTRLYKLGEELSARTKHFLLLTATPHKGDPEHFRLLLELLDKDLFADRTILEENMKSQDNPIILRRLKEEMCRFDGSPLFPERTVKTVTFRLSPEERDLYEEVTAYVSDHFNRAMQKEKRNIGFAMVILQRRLTSSLAAITSSLERRHTKLSDLLTKVQALVATQARRELKTSSDIQSDIEEQLAGVDVDTLEDLDEGARLNIEDSLLETLTTAESVEELEAEVAALERLVRKSRTTLGSGVESKFNALLDIVLRDEGLIDHGEKLLIFTEAKDTLDFLVKKLHEQGFSVAVIEGSLSMQKRIEQQELFRGDAQIMIATEAGGESINLQFCNQMLNYDIPWNPNRLEQRMGRIHRIGQKNEVFIFNLVAEDTREGKVLTALLRKMEQMRKGLGSDRVFDLVGDLLEDHDISLSELLIDCISNRRRLDDAVATIDGAVSSEHQEALLAAREEGLARRFVNLPDLREDALRSAEQALLPEHLERFFTRTLELQRGRWERRADGRLRVERVPRQLRRTHEANFRRRHGTVENTYLSTTFNKDEVGEDGKTELLGPGHPLFESVLLAAEQEFTKALAKGAVFYNVDIDEPEYLWLFKASVGDGTGRTLSQRLFALRENTSQGAFQPSHPLYLQDLVPSSGAEAVGSSDDFEVRKKAAMLFCLQHLLPEFVEEIREGREKDLELKERFLDRSFRVVISRHADRLLDMELKSQDGKEMTLAISREQSLMEDAKRRQKERLARVQLEQQHVPRAPEFLGVAEVRPLRDVAVGPTEATDVLMDAVIAHETARGRVVRDKRASALGYDAVAHTEDGREVEFLYLCPLDANDCVWFKRNEWMHLKNFARSARLYAMQGKSLVSVAAQDIELSSAKSHEGQRVSLLLLGTHPSALKNTKYKE